MEKSKQLKLVSICIPAFNAAKYIAETLACLFKQTYSNIEIIIVDDNSTDNTLDIIKTFDDGRLKVFTNPKKYAASARNFAYRNSSGSYIIFFDADDLVENDFVKKQVDRLKDDENAIVVSNWGRFYNNDLSTYREAPGTIKKDLTYKEWILGYWLEVKHTTPPGRVMMPRSIVEQTTLWDESLTLNDDFQFFNEVFFHCSIIRYSFAEFYYRSGINGLSTSKGLNSYSSNLKAIKRGIYLAQKKYPNAKELRICYSNLLKNFEYDIYPNYKELQVEVKELSKDLPISNFSFPCGGLTKLLVSIFGWKLTKRIKQKLA